MDGIWHRILEKQNGLQLSQGYLCTARTLGTIHIRQIAARGKNRKMEEWNNGPRYSRFFLCAIEPMRFGNLNLASEARYTNWG